jgi:hypothetical protein
MRACGTPKRDDARFGSTLATESLLQMRGLEPDAGLNEGRKWMN